MTLEEMQLVYESGFGLVVACYMIGLGMGLIFKIIKMAAQK
jgi:hypothetical protein